MFFTHCLGLAKRTKEETFEIKRKGLVDFLLGHYITTVYTNRENKDENFLKIRNHPLNVHITFAE
jgi:hypothetical protein